MNTLSSFKISALTFALMLAGSLPAASVTWGAGGFATGDFDSGVTGTAYLIGAPSNANVTQIETYLKTYGTSYEGDDYTVIGNTDLNKATSIGGEDGVLFSNTSLVAGTNYFTLILLDDGETFILSDLRIGTFLAGPPNEDKDIWSIDFPIMSFDPNNPATKWESGTLGDGPVPEPTVLALLALGVASAVLRRRA